MLKKFTSAILALLLALSVMTVAAVNTGAATTTNTVQAEKVSNGYITKMVSKYDDGDTTTTAYTYDSKGNLTKEVHKNSDGVTNIITHIYNSKGKLTKQVYIYKDSDGYTNTMTYTYTCTYNSKGKLTKQVKKKYCNGSTDTETTTYTYDSKGNLIKKIYSSNNDFCDITTTTTYTYNSKGNLIKDVDSYENNIEGLLSSITTYTYNGMGKMTKKVYTTKGCYGSTSTSTTTNTYDSKGNLTKQVYKSKNSYGSTSTSTTTYTYDSKGNLTKEVYKSKNSDGDTSTSTTINTYDSKGNLTKEVYTTKDSEGFTHTTTSTYTYDGYEKNTYSYGVYEFIIDKSITLTGKSAKPEIAIINELSTDTECVDFNLSYANNTKAGTGKVIVKLIDVTVEVPYTILPAKVKSLKATTVSTNSITLSWDKVKGATYYRIEKSLDGKTWDEVKTFKANKLTVYSLKTGTKYQFRVTALDASKKIAGKTSAVLKTGTITAAPAITIESTKSNTATVKIDKVKGATKYNIYLSTDGETLTKVATTTGTTATISDLTGGQKIYVRVRAVNAYGKTSAYSNVAKVNVKE